MKTRQSLLSVFLGLSILLLVIASCEQPFEEQGKLDSLKNGTLDLGSEEVNDAMIRKLQYQKEKKCGNTNGVVLTKEMLTTSVNGFSTAGINYPLDSSNFNKWDFLVVYPGIDISEQNIQTMKPAIFFYKGSNQNGAFLPSGNPVTDVTFPGGGGGPGDGGFSTPPPM